MVDAVLVTGAGTGIGLATALRLSELGYRTYASIVDGSQRSAVQEAARERGVELEVLVLDVTRSESIAQAVHTVVEQAGGIYAVVNNAGLGLRGFFEDLSDEEIRQLYDVNVFGAMAVTRAVLPHMRAARRGRVVLISSAGGRNGAMTLSGYCSGKFALEGFGECLAMEVAPFGLHVSLVEPGLVITPHFTAHRGRSKASTNTDSPYYRWFVQHESMVDDILHRRHIQPDDVAKAVARALGDGRPRLRYVVGWRAKLLIALHRYLPGELFERLYFGQVIRMVTKPREPAAGLSEALGTENATPPVSGAPPERRPDHGAARHA